jgi:hypothetical protein
MSVTLPRVEPFGRVVREGAGVDEEIAGLARDLLEWRRAMASRIVEVLAGHDGLRPGLAPGALEHTSTAQKKARNSQSGQRQRSDSHQTCGAASRPPDLLA